MSDTPRETVYLLIDGFSMMAFVAATEPMRIANRIAGRELYAWWLVSEDGAAVAASNGLRVLPDSDIAERRDLSRLAVCSGFLETRAPSPRLRRWLRGLAAHGAVLGGIDTGCFVLASAGLLDGYRVTLHWENLAAFRERYPLVEAVESLYEIGPWRFSCAGGMAATDMGLADIAAAPGSDLADAVAEQLIHDRAREADTGQRLSIIRRFDIHNAALVRTIELMEARLERPVSIARIARRVGRSPRQLERLFALELGTTPQRFYRDLRLDLAQSLVNETARGLAEIAAACGFASAAAFSRAYRQRFGESPSTSRRRPAAV